MLFFAFGLEADLGEGVVWRFDCDLRGEPDLVISPLTGQLPPPPPPPSSSTTFGNLMRSTNNVMTNSSSTGTTTL